ncbi:MAG: prepilin-type N-terminal cleavage/methylation domain-containing protein [Armatimonadota bacterium]
MSVSRLKRHGFTLPEMLTSLVLTSLILGVLVTMFILSMNVWRRCSSQSQAFPQAYLFVARLGQEMKNAYAVTVPAADVENPARSITFDLPRTDANGLNIIPFQLGNRIKYFRSDATGAEGANGASIAGTYLWRKKTNGTSGAVTYTQIADSVSNVSFGLDDSTPGRWYNSCTVAITVLGRQESEQFTATFNTKAAARNTSQIQ